MPVSKTENHSYSELECCSFFFSLVLSVIRRRDMGILGIGSAQFYQVFSYTVTSNVGVILKASSWTDMMRESACYGFVFLTPARKHHYENWMKKRGKATKTKNLCIIWHKEGCCSITSDKMIRKQFQPCVITIEDHSFTRSLHLCH